MPQPHQLVVFALDGQRYALRLPAVERVARIVSIASLPKAPDIVVGVINVRGRIVPVINVRRRFRLPERDTALSDQLVVARAARRPVALVADAVAGLHEYPGEAVVEAENVLPRLEYVEGVVKLADGLVLIHDLDKFLSLEEGESLDQAMGTA